MMTCHLSQICPHAIVKLSNSIIYRQTSLVLLKKKKGLSKYLNTSDFQSKPNLT